MVTGTYELCFCTAPGQLHAYRRIRVTLFSQWVNALSERRDVAKAIVAVDHKNAQISWSMLRNN